MQLVTRCHNYVLMLGTFALWCDSSNSQIPQDMHIPVATVHPTGFEKGESVEVKAQTYSSKDSFLTNRTH